jgi:hypothetical protein
MSPQYKRPGTPPVTGVNDVVLITTPQGTFHAASCGCNSCTGGGGATTGAQGTQGVRGSQGTQGVQGTTGIGTQGVQGSTGSGTQGVQGSTGAGTQGLQGVQGIQGNTGSGTQGVQGTKGDAGSIENLVSRVSYEHTQGAASNSWIINHNLGFKPNVTVVDSAGNIVEGEITYTNLNSLTVSFQSSFSGYAYLS